MTAVASSATINPGESGAVVVKFNGPMVGMKGVLLQVPSNDVTQPEQKLTLHFQVVQ